MVMAVPKKLKEVPTARLVDEAVVEKRLVVVAEVAVAFTMTRLLITLGRD